MLDNLFIVSHLGQLRQVEALITQKNLKNSGLVLLYTEMNLSIANMVESSYASNLFSIFKKIKLPIRPNKIDISKLLNIRKKYISLLKEIKPKKLYVLSFEGHYNLLLSYAKSKAILVYLIEEGTATYKESDSKIIGKKEKLNRILIKCTPFFSSLRETLVRFENFDKIFGSFPKLLENRFHNSNVEYFFVYNRIKENDIVVKKMIDNYNISTDDFIYLNQRYEINKKEYVLTIIEILLEFNKKFNGKVFIKMHPKDSVELIEYFAVEIKKMGIGDRIILIKESKFLIEPTIIMLNKIQGVIGLTSTSLVYTPIISKETKVYSIASILLDKIDNSLDNKNGISLIKNHFDILKSFEHIYFLKNIDDLRIL